MIDLPADPTPQAKDWAPKAGPQSKLRMYVYDELETVGAFAERRAPTEIPPLVLLPPLFSAPLGSASKSVDTAALPGAATFASASPPLPAEVAEPTTSVNVASCELTYVTGAAPDPPVIKVAFTPRAAAVGDSGQMTAMDGCANPEFPTSTVAVLSLSSHCTIERSRSGTTTSYEKTPRVMFSAVPFRFKMPIVMTRESSGRVGRRSEAVVGRGFPPLDGSVSTLELALSADVPPVAARTASRADATYDVTPRERARRRAGEDASTCAADAAALSPRSLRDGGAGYTVDGVTNSEKGDTPHCVSVSADPAGSAAAVADDAEIAGAGCAMRRFTGRVDDDEHGFSAGDTARAIGAPPVRAIAFPLTAAPQYVPPGVDASAGGFDTGTSVPTGTVVRRDATRRLSADVI